MYPGYPPQPGYPGYPPPPPPRRGITIPKAVIVGFLIGLVVLLAGIASVIAVVVLQSPAAAAEVRREPVRTEGPNPFMANVGTDQLAVAPPAGTSGRFSASTPGLYGGTRENASCDRDQLVRFLRENPDKAAAWAGVLGIPVADIATYVAGLTPVILRADTAVTNHGFAGGRATAVQAVLQAGTAVLVDRYGTPVTKCYCGNPLTKPATYTRPRYTGSTWTRFSSTTVVVVVTTTVVIEKFTLVDPATNEPFDRPRGSGGDRDAPASAAPALSAPPSGSATSQPPPSNASEKDAMDLLMRRFEVCKNVKVPWQVDTVVDIKTRDSETRGIYIITITDRLTDGSTIVFEFRVDPANDKMYAANDKAQEIGQYCPALLGHE